MDDHSRAKLDPRRAVLSRIKEKVLERLEHDAAPQEPEDDSFLLGSGLAKDLIEAVEILVGMQARLGIAVPEGHRALMRIFNTVADLILAQQVASPAYQVH